MGATTTSNDAAESLEQLLAHVHDGRIQVPEFQRDISLHDEWIKSLLASVSLTYPIGAVTLLQAGNPDLQFEVHPVPGAPATSTDPERLLIDGQQRITALYQVLASGRAAQIDDEQQRPIPRWYYIDINGALDPNADRDEAIVALPDTRPVESEWEQGLFPLRLVFSADAELRHWQHGFARDRMMQRFETDVLRAFWACVVPTISVGKESTRWSVRVHGGPDGRTLSDRFRVADPDAGHG